MLSGKHILLGVSGSIAAYKAPDIVRRLQDEGASVRVVMTRSATRFVSALTFEAVSGTPVLCDEFQGGAFGPMGHISVTEGLDCAIIAPATANIIGKAATGIADDTLSTALLTLSCPLLIAPAMNDRMYQHAVVQRNLRTLVQDGVRLVEPEEGALACGAEGKGRLASADRIVQALVDVLSISRVLAGIKVLVTAGPTREKIDAVRFLSNPSSGRMGFALAVAARERGAEVVLVTGPTELVDPTGMKVVHVTSAEEMRSAVIAEAEESAVIIMAAAVSDFRPVERAQGKIRKDQAPMTLPLVRTPDILAQLGAQKGNRILVGFAAESDQVVDRARTKLEAKNLDLIAANDITEEGSGFGASTNRVELVWRSGMVEELPMLSKEEVAGLIIDKVSEVMAKQGL